MQRAVLTGVLPPDICRELIWAARSLAVVGYRDCVASATIFDVASAAPALLMPLVRVCGVGGWVGDVCVWGGWWGGGGGG